MKKLRFLLLLSLTGFVLMGCPPDPDPPKVDPKTSAELEHVPVFENSRGSMVAMLNTFFVNINDTLIGSTYGTARAKFFAESSTTTAVDAGTVQVRPLGSSTYETLTKNTAHVYEYKSGSGNGIQFHTNPQSEWNVSGNATNDIPAIENENYGGFPGDPLFKGPVPTINSSSDYMVEVRRPNPNAHGTIFALHGSKGSVVERGAASATSHTFTAAQIASVGKGDAVLQVGAYLAKPITKDGKTFHLVNQKLASQDVVIE